MIQNFGFYDKQVQFEYWLMIDNIKKGQSHFRHGIPAKGKNHST